MLSAEDESWHWRVKSQLLHQSKASLIKLNLYEPCREKTCLADLRPGKIQTSLLSYGDHLDNESVDLSHWYANGIN